MEFTSQAFEEMQEQNVRLLQQLREKDDANLKLMSEVRQTVAFLQRAFFSTRDRRVTLGFHGMMPWHAQLFLFAED